MSRLPLSGDPHGDFLNPVLGDDAADSGTRRYFCEECGERVTREAECAAIGLDPDAPRCKWCCRCSDCAADMYAALHSPETRNDAL